MPLVEIPFVVEQNYDGWRLDRYLQQKLGRASRTRVQQLIRDCLVQDGGRKLKPSTTVSAGMCIRILKEETAEPDGIPDEVDVLHDRDGVVVIDKPAGLPVHPTARYYKGTLTTILGRDHRDELGRRPDPAHRIDRETSGAIVCGRHREITRALKALFASQRVARARDGRAEDGESAGVRKEYLAIVHGHPAWSTRRIEHPLALTGEHAVRIRMSIVAPSHPKAQAASTVARVLERLVDASGTPFALVGCLLETGRQHQVRAHLQAEGHPLVGDKIYGHDETVFVRFTEGRMTEEDIAELRLPRQALHAWRLAFAHPFTGEQVRVEAPPAEDLRALHRTLQPATATSNQVDTIT